MKILPQDTIQKKLRKHEKTSGDGNGYQSLTPMVTDGVTGFVNLMSPALHFASVAIKLLSMDRVERRQ